VRKYKKILFIVIFFLVIAFIFYIPRLITIKRIVCKTQFGECDQLIIDETNKLINNKMYFAKKNIHLYLKNNYLVKDFSIQYKIPDTLEIDLIIAKSKYCIKSENYDVFSYVSKEGRVLELRKTCNLPVVYIKDTAYNVGDVIKNEYLSALDLLNNIFISYNVKEGYIVENNLEITLLQGYKVILPLNKDNQVLLGALRLIINRLNTDDSESRIIEGRINVIDLRYENPVLR
jgi:hypothetical protein